MKQIISTVSLLIVFVLTSYGQCDNINVLHKQNKFDDYYYIKPITLKNRLGQTLSINIESSGSDYLLYLRVTGTKSKCIRKDNEEIIFIFNDTTKVQPINRVESNCDGETGILLSSVKPSEFELSCENSYSIFSFPYDNFLTFRDERLTNVRVYTSKDYADFALNNQQSELLNKRFNSLILVAKRNDIFFN